MRGRWWTPQSDGCSLSGALRGMVGGVGAVWHRSVPYGSPAWGREGFEVVAMGVEKTGEKQYVRGPKSGPQGTYFERLREVADLRYDDSADDAAHQLVLDKISACEDLVRQYAQTTGSAPRKCAARSTSGRGRSWRTWGRRGTSCATGATWWSRPEG